MENKIMKFQIFCIEVFKIHHNLSGKEVVKLFEKYGVLDYLSENFDVLHTVGENFIVNDIDEYLKSRNANIN
nr:DUF3791 domain-containing protein [uncultured Ruminococcus sp.]